MKLVSVGHQGRVVAGLWLTNGVLDLAAAAKQGGERAPMTSMLEIIRGGEDSYGALKRLAARAAQFSAALLPHAAVELLAPIPQPLRNIFCVGRNYLDHVKEGHQARGTDVKLPEVPQFFTKATHAMNSANGDVRLDPRLTQLLDYEVELAVIIGRSGRDISAAQAFDHVFGYAVSNDVTARDVQRRHEQWFKGKSLDTSFPFGPWIIDREEVGDPSTLELVLTVNGEERQRAKVSQMIFDIPTIIASLSAGLTLEAGDIIATGTPSGVGYAMKPPRSLRGGDLMVTAISRIGELRNRIVEV
ncbi:MAG TPA: fumarylacetoacetate hydrolase family protein [Steroidobacteraceae bacterium]|jgi:2-keto-4-pentenoate hydratase/2-oxohepta-3-ene-1,7-dioic acid hydratase in catechol pathway